jgi:hypothetical protein
MSFKFDETKDFSANLHGFREYLESEDTELAAILRSNIESLSKLSDESQRRAARTAFNENIKKALDKLIASPKQE